MSYRRKEPSQLRCLKPLCCTGIAAIMIGAMASFERANCDLAASTGGQVIACPSLPGIAWFVAWAAFAGGIIASGWRAWCDFGPRQEYWRDLES